MFLKKIMLYCNKTALETVVCVYECSSKAVQMCSIVKLYIENEINIRLSVGISGLNLH